MTWGRQHRSRRYWQGVVWTYRSQRTCACVEIANVENREVPSAHGVMSRCHRPGRPENRKCNAGMNADGMADGAVVPSTRTNKAAAAVAEPVEERDLIEGSISDRDVDALDSEPDQELTRASRGITTGSVALCRDRSTQRRSRVSQGSGTDLCRRGRLATAVPTATLENHRRTLPSDEPTFAEQKDAASVGRADSVTKRTIFLENVQRFPASVTRQIQRRIAYLPYPQYTQNAEAFLAALCVLWGSSVDSCGRVCQFAIVNAALRITSAIRSAAPPSHSSGILRLSYLPALTFSYASKIAFVAEPTS